MTPCSRPDCIATREALARELAYRTLGGTPPPTDQEIWLPLRAFAGYEVSSAGRVRSLRRQVLNKSGVVQTFSGRLLRAQPNGNGYLRVHLPGDQRVFVHALVLDSFVGPRPDGAVIRHLDGDHLNNRVSNLMYGTVSENSLDTVRHGRNHYAVRSRCPRDHPLLLPNLVASVLRQGRRECLACARGRARLRYYGEVQPSLARIKEVSDVYLRAIDPSLMDPGSLPANVTLPPPESASDVSAPELRRQSLASSRPSVK